MADKLNPCPFCGKEAFVRSGSNWYGAGCDTTSAGVMCPGYCSARQHHTEDGAKAAWNRRAAPPVGDDGLRPLRAMPILSQHLLGLIGDYGMARTDGLFEADRLYLWEQLIAGIKEYAAEQAREAQREAYEAGRRAAVPAQTGTQPADDNVDTREFRLLLAECPTVTEAPFDLRQRIKAELARRAAVSTASAPVHRDLAGLNQFISLYCNGDSSLIACAEAAWYRCMMLNYPTGAAPSSPVE